MGLQSNELCKFIKKEKMAKDALPVHMTYMFSENIALLGD